jgi:small subunit ribosomal protein S21
MASITVKQGEDINRAIKRFKRKVEKEGIMKELKKRRHYLKPSERKKEKRALAAKRRRKANARKKLR